MSVDHASVVACGVAQILVERSGCNWEGWGLGAGAGHDQGT